MMQYEKMSKSRGNVVTIDEVVCGVRDLAEGFCFRAVSGEEINFRDAGVWRNPMDGCYYTSTRSGQKPVFLCRDGIADVPPLMWNGHVIEQHPEFVSVEHV